MNKNTLAIIANILIVCFSCIGIYMSNHGIEIFYYYTQISNILAGISALLFVIFMFIRKEVAQVPFPIMLFKFVTTTMLFLTFIVVIAILIPQNQLAGSPLPWHFFLIGGGMPFVHVLNPITAFISFSFFENDKRFNKKNNLYYPLLATLLYGIVMVILNYMNIFEGPYFFLKVHSQPIYMTIIWFVIILIINYVLAKILLIQNQKRVPRRLSRIKEKIAQQ